MHIVRQLILDAIGCSAVQVVSVGEAWQLLQSGSAARHSAETAMNDRSSRSHCVLCVRVRGQSRLTGEAGPPAMLALATGAYSQREPSQMTASALEALLC